MGLQRTPPNRSQPLPSVSPRPLIPPNEIEDETPRIEIDEEKAVEADKTTISNISDSKAFVPRHPGVMRTPPGDQADLDNNLTERIEHVDERPIRPAPTPSPIPDSPKQLPEVDDQPMILDDTASNEVEDENEAENIVENAMQIDEPSPEKPIKSRKEDDAHQSITPPTGSLSAQAGPSNIHPPTTPSSQPSIPKTPRSRRKTMEPLPSPPRPQALQEEEYEFGRRYQLTMETLERAVKAGAQRWTTEHLKGCFPLLTKELGRPMEDVCFSASQTMRSNILVHAHSHLDHYKVGPALRAIDEVDKEARDYLRANPPDSESGKLGRPDAWRPDVTPNALVASSVLPIYDEAYAKLREEYLEMRNYCSEKYKSIVEKQNQLNEIENGVADGVIDLEKTIEILDDLPVEDMMIWTESTETKLETRAPEQVQ
ncbi:uncharacterized protein I206_103883 [Kwoniella pini CBS 10737]|uniref:Uncharacterized protein n=1 Tax=Kwoniella pini CBS 10737 TaxID=1296096 RepID=A0A1B9I3A4_9TREE|nr:uncharacterized protein I206_04544 [Kwoniella pini CBS 10737]OCF50013.1 hypothetical protein I206_04544 [Kwoniella pini CBS 10737]